METLHHTNLQETIKVYFALRAEYGRAMFPANCWRLAIWYTQPGRTF